VASGWILFNRAIILGRDLGPAIRKGQHSSTVGDRVGDNIGLGRTVPTKVNYKSITNKSRARAAALGLPLDPPPFFFEGEIRLSGSYMNLSCAALGFIVLLAFRLFLPDPVRPLPSLSLLLMTSIGAAVFYFGIRFVTYWAIWRKISGNYRQKGGRYLGANGELPKNAFLAVFMAPLAAFGVLYLILADPGGVLGPGWWVAIAVVAGIAFRDLKAAWKVLFLDQARWLKETPRGLDILKPVVGDS
jgi:hypothetical protein